MAYKDKRKRLVVDLLPEDHEEVIKHSQNRGESIYKWVVDAIAEKIKQEKQYD